MPAQTFTEAIARRPLVFDGAMGTMIYRRGVFLNTCYDELCLSRPDMIREIHAEYVAAGVDVIETNSFGANRRRLGAFGLADKVQSINRAAAALAREAAGANVFVAASVGPCLGVGEALNPRLAGELAASYAEQTGALAAGGVDVVLLETFHDLRELALAAAEARRHGLPVIASFSLGAPPPGLTPPTVEEVARALDADPNVDLVGLNCGQGPAGLLDAARTALRHTRKPLVVMPNAGGTSDVGGRLLSLDSPEYFTEYCKRFIEIGVRGVGGCCGTTPAHLRAAVKALRGLSGVREHVEIRRSEDKAGCEPIPLDRKSAFGARLRAGSRVTSVELLPPQNTDGVERFLEQCRRCREAGVDAVNLPDGPRACARISVTAAALLARQATGIEPIPHYCCRDRNLIGTQSDLLGAAALGLKTWLFITGDPPKLGNYPDATGVFDVDAIGLCRLVGNLNRGLDAAGEPIGAAAGLVVGVGANPVAVDPAREAERFLRKQEAGAEYAITQPVFDADALFRFLDRVGAAGPAIPILAGLYPLLSFRNADFMNRHVPGVVVPDAILERMSRCQTKEDGIRAGVEIAIAIRDRIASRVAGLQVSAPLGRIDAALCVLGL